MYNGGDPMVALFFALTLCPSPGRRGKEESPHLRREREERKPFSLWEKDLG